MPDTASVTVGSVTIARHPAMRTIAAAPYARPLPSTAQHRAWQTVFAQRWVQGHMVLTLLASVVAVMLVLRPATYPMGMLLLGFAIVGIALGALSISLLHSHRIDQATVLMLICDLLALGVGLTLIGPRAEVYAMLPGALLITALLADYVLVIAGGVVAMLAYTFTVALTQVGTVHPMLVLSGSGVVWLDLIVVVAGMGLLLTALALAMRQLRAALAGEAAATHCVSVLERRIHTKRTIIDADALALQTQLMQAMHAQATQTITTCEDLAPLAQMVNTAAARIPGLLRDREERIRLEQAIRELATALETLWAGFTVQWPAPSHTSVDRLITILRPSHAATDVTWKPPR